MAKQVPEQPTKKQKLQEKADAITGNPSVKEAIEEINLQLEELRKKLEPNG